MWGCSSAFDLSPQSAGDHGAFYLFTTEHERSQTSSVHHGARETTETSSAHHAARKTTETSSAHHGARETTETSSAHDGAREITETSSVHHGARETTETSSAHHGARETTETSSAHHGARETTETSWRTYTPTGNVEPCGTRRRDHEPFGHWETHTVVARLRLDGPKQHAVRAAVEAMDIELVTLRPCRTVDRQL
jgi:hypothetical protein